MKVAVLFGGDSLERDVSQASGAQVVKALRARGHTVRAVDAERGLLAASEEQRLLTGRIALAPPEHEAAIALPTVLATPDLRDVDVIFLAMHGGVGENGTIQALLDLAGLTYTGSGKLGSALGMNKDISKRLFLAAGIPTAPWRMAPVAPEIVAGQLGFPVIVKPNSQGSTVGLTLARNSDELDASVAVARRFDDEVMIERYVPGRELTVGVLDDAALAVGEIIPAKGGIFDYEAKYQAGGAEEIFPAEIEADVAARAQELAVRVSQALKLECYCRIDFRLDPDGRLWCLEANTLPGLTAGSLLPRSAAAVGIDFPTLCERICELALTRRSEARMPRPAREHDDR